jgi:hypothetical protein
MRSNPVPWWRGETPVLIADLPYHLPRRPNGKRLGLSTVWRWTLAGQRGVRLRRFHAGTNWATTLEELARFQAALTEVSVGA